MLRFVHTADLHLDTPFSARFTAKQAALRRSEMMRTFRDIAARAGEAELFFISGDLFDGQYVSGDTAAFLKRCFEEIPKTQVFIAAGNHDPLTSGSVYRQVSWSENVHIFDTKTQYFDFPEWNLRVHGRSFEFQRTEETLVEPLELAENWCNVLVLHGEVTADGGASLYNPIYRSALEQSGVDYAALGHIHTATELLRCGKVYYGYPGIPEGRGFDETGPKGCFVGQIEKGIVTAQWVPVSQRCFRWIQADMTGLADSIEVLETVSSALREAGKPDDIYRLTLTGKAAPGAVSPELIREQLREKVFFLEIKDETSPVYSLEEIARESSLRGNFAAAMLARIDEMPEAEKEIGFLAAELGLAAMEGGGKG